MLTIEVMLLALSFVAVLLAVRKGDTWNANERGIRKVTKYGWTAIGIGSVAFVLGVTKQIYQLHLAAQKATELQTTYEGLERATIRYEALRTGTLVAFDRMKEELEASVRDIKINLKIPAFEKVVLGQIIHVAVPEETVSSMKDGLDQAKNRMLEAIENTRRDYQRLTDPAFGSSAVAAHGQHQ